MGFVRRQDGYPMIALVTGISGSSQEASGIHALATKFRQNSRFRSFVILEFAPTGPGRLPDDIEYFIGTHGVPSPFFLIGHSAGGHAIVWFAWRNPSIRIRRLITLDPFPWSDLPSVPASVARAVNHWTSRGGFGNVGGPIAGAANIDYGMETHAEGPPLGTHVFTHVNLDDCTLIHQLVIGEVLSAL